MKRLADIVFSFIGLVILLPFLFIFALFIFIGSGLPVFYSQERIGKNGITFRLLKFRTMKKGSDAKSLLTIGKKDTRITSAGYFLRKYKIDELPQLFNVLIGDMSLVGPRPEVKKYVSLYTEEQRRVLSVRPGITDPASIQYSRENELLSRSEDPEGYYIREVMPRKLKLNLKYIEERDFFTDLKIIFQTLGKILH